MPLDERKPFPGTSSEKPGRPPSFGRMTTGEAAAFLAGMRWAASLCFWRVAELNAEGRSEAVEAELCGEAIHAEALDLERSK